MSTGSTKTATREGYPPPLGAKHEGAGRDAQSERPTAGAGGLPCRPGGGRRRHPAGRIMTSRPRQPFAGERIQADPTQLRAQAEVIAAKTRIAARHVRRRRLGLSWDDSGDAVEGLADAG